MKSNNKNDLKELLISSVIYIALLALGVLFWGIYNALEDRFPIAREIVEWLSVGYAFAFALLLIRKTISKRRETKQGDPDL